MVRIEAEERYRLWLTRDDASRDVSGRSVRFAACRSIIVEYGYCGKIVVSDAASLVSLTPSAI